jgi:hypothetical protein
MRRFRSLAGILTGLLLVPAILEAQTAVRLPEQDNVLSGTTAVLFSIGKDEGQDWELLGRVSQVAFDKNDNLFIFDSESSRILMFDAKGAFLREIGKKGGGPGEFANPSGFVLLSNGTIAVSDNGNYQLFSADGKYLRTALRESTGTILLGGLPAGAIGDAILVRGRLPIPGLRGEPESPNGKVKLPIHLDQPGEVISRTTLYEIEQPAPIVQQQGTGPGGRGSFTVTRSANKVFDPTIQLAAMPDAAVIAHETAYRVHIVNPNGSVARVIERSLPVRKVTRRDQDRAREFERERLSNTNLPTIAFSGGGGGVARSGGGPMTSQQIEERIQSLTFAEEISHIRKIVGDPSGRLWIERTAQDPFADGPIDVVDFKAGRYIGTLRGQTMPAAISATGRAAWILKDDMDVQRVEVRQLPANWR